MNQISCWVATLAGLVTGIIGLQEFVLETAPTNLGVLGFVLWAMTPYAFILVMVRISKSTAGMVVVFVLACLNAAFGLFVNIDALYLHPTPGYSFVQAAPIVYAYAPVLQWGSLLVGSALVIFLNKKAAREERTTFENH